jgi:hypothetical protein
MSETCISSCSFKIEAIVIRLSPIGLIRALLGAKKTYQSQSFSGEGEMKPNTKRQDVPAICCDAATCAGKNVAAVEVFSLKDPTGKQQLVCLCQKHSAQPCDVMLGQKAGGGMVNTIEGTYKSLFNI